MVGAMTPSMGTNEHVDVLAEAVHVWRTWTLHEDPRTRTPLLRPIGDDRRPWTPRVPMRARCFRRRSHRAPEERCSCGLYAVKSPHLLRAARAPAVLGTVDLWGRIMEHERGYRAELAYPQRLGLICPFCFWQRGAGTATVDHVARVGRRGLTPSCTSHLATAIDTGYPVTELLDPTDVLGSLLATYLVEPIEPQADRLTSPDSDRGVGTAGTPRR